jgi:hypothetical protein
MRSAPFDNNDPIQMHFREIGQTWLGFGTVLGFAESFIKDESLRCAYPRCAIPNLRAGIRLSCGGCFGTYHDWFRVANCSNVI